MRSLTAHDEAAAVAEWIETRWSGGRRSAAVLCRKRSQFTLVAEALAARNIPHEVVGLGGLLLTPEVADVISLLTVVQDPSRGDRLMRLLTGPPGLLGPADLDGLGAWARHLARQARAELGDDAAPPGPDDAVTIIDALDLRRPIYAQTSTYGHFGRELPDFTWERTDRVEALRAALGR